MHKSLTALSAVCLLALSAKGFGAGADQPTILDISDNPAFYTASDLGAKSAEVKDLDRLIRPVLKKLFKDAKITAESTAPETMLDGEVVENRFTYTVSTLMATGDDTRLHGALRAVGFAPNPRLGRKPVGARGIVKMSLSKTISRHPYSLVITMDMHKQRIIVESYRLGSKYERLK